jgi:hypothetical protein
MWKTVTKINCEQGRDSQLHAYRSWLADHRRAWRLDQNGYAIAEFVLARVAAFEQALQGLGWLDGRNILCDD